LTDVATVDPDAFNRLEVRLDTAARRKEFLVNGQQVASRDLPPSWWQVYDYYLTDFAYGALRMETWSAESLDLSSGGGTYEAYFDNYSADVTGSPRESPEPASLILLALGAAGMACSGWRRFVVRTDLLNKES
jgi:PEP-CTERM motif